MISFFDWESFVWNIDTIQELTAIFVFNSCWLLNKGAGLWDIFQRVTNYPELINVFFVSDDGNTLFAINFSHNLFTNKVFNFHWFVIVDNVNQNWEMCISKSHLEFVTSGDTSNHVFDMRWQGLNGTFLFSCSEPHLLRIIYFERALWFPWPTSF